MSQIGNKTECGMLGFVIALGMILRKNFFGRGGGKTGVEINSQEDGVVHQRKKGSAKNVVFLTKL